MKLRRDRLAIGVFVGMSIVATLLGCETSPSYYPASEATVGAPPAMKEIRLTASSDDTIWEPNDVVIEQGQTYRGLEFVLENPTAVAHGFTVPGLFERVTETRRRKVGNGGSHDVEVLVHNKKPLNVVVPPGETMHVAVSTDDLKSIDALGRNYRFFCPIHKDIVAGGSIHVVG